MYCHRDRVAVGKVANLAQGWAAADDHNADRHLHYVCATLQHRF